MSTVTMTFVQAIHVLAKFVHISNISAVIDLILTKLVGVNIVSGPFIFLDKIFLVQTSSDLNILKTKLFLDQIFCA